MTVGQARSGGGRPPSEFFLQLLLHLEQQALVHSDYAVFFLDLPLQHVPQVLDRGRNLHVLALLHLEFLRLLQHFELYRFVELLVLGLQLADRLLVPVYLLHIPFFHVLNLGFPVAFLLLELVGEPLQFFLVLGLCLIGRLHQIIDDFGNFLVVVLLGALRLEVLDLLDLVMQLVFQTAVLVLEGLHARLQIIVLTKLLNRLRQFRIDCDEFLQRLLERIVLLQQPLVLVPQLMHLVLLAHPTYYYTRSKINNHLSTHAYLSHPCYQVYRHIMARLEKSFQDYFTLPVLLRPVADTPTTSMERIHSGLSMEDCQLVIDERYEPPRRDTLTQLLQDRNKNIRQHLSFKLTQMQNQWSEYQIIYQCRFVVGVYDPVGEVNFIEEWNKLLKSAGDEGKKVVGLIIMTTKACDELEIQDQFIIVPETLHVEEILAFLEPWLYMLLAKVEDHTCSLIKELQKEDNHFIVYNKHEEKSEPKTSRRKKRGRCLKLCGDLCLSLHLVPQAYKFFVQSEEILRKLDDYMWVLGCNQGKLACFTTDFTLETNDKPEAIQECREECMNLSKKIKVPQLQTENYFKILKIYTSLPDQFDKMASSYVANIATNHSTSERFSILVQLAILYKETGMVRKHNNLLYKAALLAVDLNPKIVNLLLMTILQTDMLKQWPALQAHIIKMIINNNAEPAEEILHLQLLECCNQVLSNRDIEVTLEALTRRNFQRVELKETNMIQIRSVACIESIFKPKLNKISKQSPKKGGPGFFMNWRKKQTIYLFQQNETALFQINMRNATKHDLHCLLKLNFDTFSTDYHSVILEPALNKIKIQHKFKLMQQNEFSLVSVSVLIFNFSFTIPVNPIKVEIYEEYPEFRICVPEVINNEESSLFEFPLTITRNKAYLDVVKVKLTVSVFYTLEVGFQETSFTFSGEQDIEKKCLVVSEEYPFEQSANNRQLLRLESFKVDKKYLKKVEVRLEAIRSEESKYQIMTSAAATFNFIRSIWCEVELITTPTEQLFSLKDERLIEDYFIIYLSVHKKENNLAPYEIILDGVRKALSQETKIIVSKKMRKIKKQVVGAPIKIQLEWKNLTKSEQCGKIVYEIPVGDKMIESGRKVNWNAGGWNGQQSLILKGNQSLNVSYEVSGQGDLGHSFIVKAKHLSDLRKYLLEGKKTLKQRDKDTPLRNSMKIKFFFEYKESYILGIRFEDGETYWQPCLYEVAHS